MTDVPTLGYEPTIATDASVAQKAAWVVYDWANSGYGLILVGPLFQVWFIGEKIPDGLTVFGNVIPPSGIYALLVAATSLMITIAAPVVGAVADFKGWTKRLFTAHSVVGASVATLILFAGELPWWYAAIIFLISNYCFGMSFSLYNAFLPTLARPERQGRLSGWGFACGYIGGAVALIVASFAIAPLAQRLGLPLSPMTWGLAFAGIWWLVFSIPAFWLLDEVPAVGSPPTGSLVLAGFRRVGYTFQHLRQYRTLFFFLVVYLVYANGVDTIINLSAAFGTDALNMSGPALIQMFLIVQFVAFVGAFIFGYLSDLIGNKRTIVINLVVMIIATSLCGLITRPRVVFGAELSPSTMFTILGGMIGLVLGGVQSSSRALMSLLAPTEIRAEAFGFYSISGKAISVAGPLLFFFLSMVNAQAAIFAVLPFLVIGLIGILFVPEPRQS